MDRAVPVVALTLLSLVSLVSPSSAATFAEGLTARGFELVVDTDGVTVFRDTRAETIRLVAEGRIEAPPVAVRAALLDYERHVGVVSRLAESRVLERGPASLLVYQRLSLPVVSDRDMALRVTWGGAPTKSWIAFEAVREGGPAATDGVVRLTRYTGRWQLQAVDGGRATRARLSMDMDMGGSLPPRLASANAGQDVPALYAAITRLLGQTAAGR